MELGSFARRMYLRADNVPREVNNIVRRFALLTDQLLVLSTPVDKGRARSNWLVSLGQPNETQIEPYSPGSQLGRGETANAQAALAQAERELSLRQPEQTVYINNNLPYIQRLNDGWSAQAPALFIETAIQTALNEVAGTRINTTPNITPRAPAPPRARDPNTGRFISGN